MAKKYNMTESEEALLKALVLMQELAEDTQRTSESDLKEKCNAMALLAGLYYEGIYYEADRTKTVQLLQQIISIMDHPESLNSLGRMYAKGHGGLQRDYEKACDLFKRAQAQGILAAYRNLARLYRQGRGVEADPQKCIEMLSEAADRGHLVSKHTLAGVYLDGKVVEKDVAKGLKLLEEAAQAGCIISQMKVSTSLVSLVLVLTCPV